MSNQAIKGHAAKFSRGKALLHDPSLNKGTVFNAPEEKLWVCTDCFRARFLSGGECFALINNVRA